MRYLCFMNGALARMRCSGPFFVIENEAGGAIWVPLTICETSCKDELFRIDAPGAMIEVLLNIPLRQNRAQLAEVAGPGKKFVPR